MQTMHLQPQKKHYFLHLLQSLSQMFLPQPQSFLHLLHRLLPVEHHSQIHSLLLLSLQRQTHLSVRKSRTQIRETLRLLLHFVPHLEPQQMPLAMPTMQKQKQIAMPILLKQKQIVRKSRTQIINRKHLLLHFVPPILLKQKPLAMPILRKYKQIVRNLLTTVRNTWKNNLRPQQDRLFSMPIHLHECYSNLHCPHFLSILLLLILPIQVPFVPVPLRFLLLLLRLPPILVRFVMPIVRNLPNRQYGQTNLVLLLICRLPTVLPLLPNLRLYRHVDDILYHVRLFLLTRVYGLDLSPKQRNRSHLPLRFFRAVCYAVSYILQTSLLTSVNHYTCRLVYHQLIHLNHK